MLEFYYDNICMIRQKTQHRAQASLPWTKERRRNAAFMYNFLQKKTE